MKKIPESSEYLRPPEVLYEQEVKKVLEIINDQRLSADEDIDHFTIHSSQKITYIPKRRFIPVQSSGGGSSQVKIVEYIKSVLDSLPTDQPDASND
ncbi:MAG: hypothetical protein ABIJ81_03500 [Patescibacteria group bacterium]